MKRVFLIHGWAGAPDEGWRPWLKEELEKHGFTVFNLAMPNTDYPKQNGWVSHIKNAVASPDEDCYFVGHSLGCIAILRYLEQLPEDQKVGGAILVAGFDNDLGIDELSDFFHTPIEWEKIRSSADTFVSIESDNDPYDLAKYSEVFEKELHSKTIIEHNMFHFSENDGITELPIVLENLLQIAEH